jgi:hypothetical protein
MPPRDSLEVIDRLIRTEQLRAMPDGSVRLSDTVGPRLAAQIEQVGLTPRLREILRRPGSEWTSDTLIQQGGIGRDLNGRELAVAEAVRQRIALRQIEASWNARGGPKSDVGLHLGERITIAPTAGGYQARFRSGTLKWEPGAPIGWDVSTWVQIRLVGIECVVRQEGSDEIYGLVSCMVPSLGFVKNHIFPGGNNTISMGRSGERLWLTDVTLYKGPIVDVKLWCGLIENDSGDVEEISQEIATKVSDESARLLGGMTGLPAESIANQTWYMQGIGTIAGFVLDDILGIGDDPYPFVPLVLHHDEVAAFPPPVSVTRPDDANVIERTTHSIVLEGIDDGGDRGLYKCYFLVRPAIYDPTESHDWR